MAATITETIMIGTRVRAEHYRLVEGHSEMSVEPGTIVGDLDFGYLVEFDDGTQAGVFASEIHERQ